MIFTKLTNQICWICGSKENLTGEHKIKKSDLKRNPIGHLGIWKGYQGQEKPIQGIKSKLLKFEKSICATCNNQTTQQADSSYEKFRDQATKQINNMIGNNADVIDLSEVSNLNNAGRIELARYFAKHIGCQIDYSKFPVPCRLSRFVRCETNKACVSLKIRPAPWVFQDNTTGDFSQINGIGGIMLAHSGNVVSLPSHYQAAYMTDGLQFIITMKLNRFEALDIWLFHRKRMGKTKIDITNDRAKHLGLPYDR